MNKEDQMKTWRSASPFYIQRGSMVRREEQRILEEAAGFASGFSRLLALCQGLFAPPPLALCTYYGSKMGASS